MLSRISLVLAVFALPFIVAATATAAVTTPARTLTAAATVGGDKINNNTTDVKGLMTLEGVGRKVG